MAEVWSAISAFFTEYEIAFRVLIVVAACLIANWVLRFLLTRTVNGYVSNVKRSQAVDSTQELDLSHNNARVVQRTRTLGTFGRNVISWATAIVGFFLVLAQFNIDLTAVIASAGFLAAGLAFGAQNIVKDVLNGVFMVFEDQLGVGDWITINDISGTVEDVGIRVTQVRSIDGMLWFVRNGEILFLGNASQDWGRALIDITVAGDEDLNEVEAVILTAAQEVITRPGIISRVIGEPEVWGVESAFGDRVTLRLALRTRPESQWAIQRALRPALVHAFKEAGIQLATELPKFPGGTTK